MTARAAVLAASAVPVAWARQLTICHFTVAHSELKSRSFHRELLPLAAAGATVRYLAPMPFGSRRDRMHFVPLPQRSSRMGRIFSTVGLMPLLLSQDAGVYHFQDPELFPVAFALKLIFRKRVVYDAYEDFPSLVGAKKSIPRFCRPQAAKLMGAIESLAARCFDAVITADTATLRRFARLRQSRKLVFYNFPNLDFFPAPPPPDHAVVKSFDIVYRGGLSVRAGTEVLLEALSLLAAKRAAVRLLLIGYFDNAQSESQFRQKVRALGLEANIEIRGRIPHEEMAAALGSARIGVSPLLPVPKFLSNIPVKIFEYWACALPVVATDLPPMRPFFRNGAAGLLVATSHPDELAGSLARSMGWLLDHPEVARQMGERGRALVAGRFNNTAEIPKLRRLFERIAGPRPREAEEGR